MFKGGEAEDIGTSLKSTYPLSDISYVQYVVNDISLSRVAVEFFQDCPGDGAPPKPDAATPLPGTRMRAHRDRDGAVAGPAQGDMDAFEFAAQAAAVRPFRPATVDAAVLDSGRCAGEALSMTMGGRRRQAT